MCSRLQICRRHRLCYLQCSCNSFGRADLLGMGLGSAKPPPRNPVVIGNGVLCRDSQKDKMTVKRLLLEIACWLPRGTATGAISLLIFGYYVFYSCCCFRSSMSSVWLRLDIAPCCSCWFLPTLVISLCPLVTPCLGCTPASYLLGCIL